MKIVGSFLFKAATVLTLSLIVVKLSNTDVSATSTLSGMLEDKVPAWYDKKMLREERLNKYKL